MNQSDQWDAILYDTNHAFVSQLAGGLIDLLAPKAGERILDLGCGTGVLAHKIASTGAVVTGVDASPAMIAQAKKNYPQIDFAVADATEMTFNEPFDAIFSNAALHWVKPPDKAAARMFAAVKPGGRLVLEMGGRGNVSTICKAGIEAGRSLGIDLAPMININYFPSIAEYATVLEQAGFAVGYAVLFDRATELSDGESGLRNWMRMFRPHAEQAVPDHLTEAFFGSMEDRCRPKLFCDGTWYADYRRLRLTAVRPVG